MLQVDQVKDLEAVALGPQTHPRIGQNITLGIGDYIVGVGRENVGLNKGVGLPGSTGADDQGVIVFRLPIIDR